MLELVKNSYDADAVNCRVILSNDGVTVQDDGDGMTVEDILRGWLVLGASRKESRKRTKLLGRVPAGNKGLGRLAALRLGEVARMSTKPRGTHERHRLELDWKKFDRAGLVDEVPIEVSTTSESSTANQGTLIEVRKLRRKITKPEVRRLARAMVLLADPFGDQESGFKPVLVAPDFEDLSKLVSERYFGDAEFHLSASLKGGRARAEVRDWRGEVLFAARHPELRTTADHPRYVAPNAQFDFWAFNLNAQTFVTRASTLAEVRAWLAAFGGVHVYTNGLRVAPYGNPGDDWLEINLARARSPEFRPSTNNAIGRIVLDDPDEALIQKTDRGGFIEGDEFHDLRQFAIDMLDWMAKCRLSEAEKRRGTVRQEVATASQSTRKTVQDSIKGIGDASAQAEVEAAFAKYNAAREREANALRREVQLYRTLSTAGITAATFAHESNGNPLKVIDLSLTSIEHRIKQELPSSYPTKFEKLIKRMRDASSSLGVLASATLRLLERDKRRASKVDLHATVQDVLSTFRPFLDGRAVQLDVSFFEGRPFVRGTQASVESIVTNLLNNSLTAFDGVDTKSRRILIESDLEAGDWILRVHDNGSGISNISLKDIWLPGQTSRPGGTGLGLTIVRDAVSDLGGTAMAEAKGDLGGATFTIRVPVLGG